MDRQFIERRDFPIARRGYDIEAVDAHLAKVADEYEAFAQRGRSEAPGGLAAAAAEQVRAIVEAAEQSADDIGREAELESRQLRQDAREEAEKLRADAGRQAREHVARVADVARGLLDRVEGLDSELASLLEGLRGGSRRVAADLSLLQAGVEQVRRAAQGTSGAVGTASEGHDESADAGPAESRPPSGDADSGGEPTEHLERADPSLDAVLDSAEAVEHPDPPADAGPEVDDPTDSVLPESAAEPGGARMVALNMALNGVARAETRDHLQRKFAVEGLEELLDDVYDRARQ